MTSICHLIIRPAKAVEMLMERTLTLLTSRCHGNARNHFHTRTHALLFVETICGIRSDFVLFISHFKFTFIGQCNEWQQTGRRCKIAHGEIFIYCVQISSGLTQPTYPPNTGTPFQGDKEHQHETEHFLLSGSVCEKAQI